MKTKTRLPFSSETIQGLARRLAGYRLETRPTEDAAAIMTATRKTAAKHGRSYSELWAMVHAAAYVIIDADPRAKIG